MPKQETVTTLTYSVEEFNQLVRAKLFGQEDVDIHYDIQEVGGDPMDRFPGVEQVVGVRVVSRKPVTK